MLDDRFWQLLLAGELPSKTAAAIADELREASDPIASLRSHPSLGEGARRRMAACSFADLEQSLAAGAQVLTEPEYPALLAECEGPPAIFIHGDRRALEAPSIAIVGTRAASAYGKACAQKFAEGFARAGVTVVSGGALGIDAAAHHGALKVKGRTAAVLAGGVDNVYPAVHKGLFAQIRESGCVVSQFACGAKPGEHKFLLRNDLIAALSLAVLVIEAPPKSGSLRTAATAADLGRDVFVVPATIDNRSYWGSFNLARDGASLVYHPDQVLEALGIDPVPEETLAPPLGDADRILSVLTVVPCPAERIVEQTGLDTSTVLSELTLLELDGRIIHDAGGYALKP